MTSRATLLLACTAVAALTLGGCGDGDTATDPAASATPAPTTSAPATAEPSESTTPTPEGETTGGDEVGAGASLPLYFVGDTPGGARLFREFQAGVAGADPLVEAADRIAAGQALDPDYRTLWPAGGFAGVTHDTAAGRIVLTLAAGGSPDEAVQLTRRQAKLAVQQMVWTLQGVTQTRDPLVVETADGTPTSIFGIDTTDGVKNAKELNVLALVNVTTPEQGATVSGSFTASGLASSFEASGPWELRAGDGSVVASGGYQAEGWIDGLYPWTAEVDLAGVAPGDYTFAAETDDPTGGTEGPGPTEDTKSITVQ